MKRDQSNPQTLSHAGSGRCRRRAPSGTCPGLGAQPTRCTQRLSSKPPPRFQRRSWSSTASRSTARSYSSALRDRSPTGACTGGQPSAPRSAESEAPATSSKPRLALYRGTTGVHSGNVCPRRSPRGPAPCTSPRRKLALSDKQRLLPRKSRGGSSSPSHSACYKRIPPAPIRSRGSSVSPFGQSVPSSHA